MNAFYGWFLLGYSLVLSGIGFFISKLLDCIKKRKKKVIEHVETK